MATVFSEILSQQLNIQPVSRVLLTHVHPCEEVCYTPTQAHASTEANDPDFNESEEEELRHSAFVQSAYEISKSFESKVTLTLKHTGTLTHNQQKSFR